MYDIPDGYRFVRYGVPETKEKFINNVGVICTAKDIFYGDKIIVEKIPEQEQPKQNPKRHKYADLIADLIHAWAEGAEIQWKNGDYWKDIEDPGFYEYDEYRIKPKTKTIRFRNWISCSGNIYVASESEQIGQDHKWLGDWQNVEIEENE